MDKLLFSTIINAPREKVWNTMLEEKSYRDWTSAFMPGSHFVGDWSKGSKMLFLGPDEPGESGMVSEIRENRPFEYVSIEHVGLVLHGKEDTSSEEVKKWAGALENYTFKDLGDKTEVLVEMNTIEEYRKMFEDSWPQALKRLKELAESG